MINAMNDKNDEKQQSIKHFKLLPMTNKFMHDAIEQLVISVISIIAFKKKIIMLLLQL
jgi:hypothetical protein